MRTFFSQLSSDDVIIFGILLLMVVVFYLIRIVKKILNQLEEGGKTVNDNSFLLSEATINKLANAIAEQIHSGPLAPAGNSEVENKVPQEKKGPSEENLPVEQDAKIRISPPPAGITSEIEKKTAIYNQIREKRLPEEALSFTRVRLEFIDGSSLADLGRERYFENHNSGSSIIVKAPDGKNLLYPYFRSKRIDKDLLPFFKGEQEFAWVKRPALCQKIGEKYKVIESGILT